MKKITALPWIGELARSVAEEAYDRGYSPEEVVEALRIFINSGKANFEVDTLDLGMGNEGRFIAARSPPRLICHFSDIFHFPPLPKRGKLFVRHIEELKESES